MTTKRVLALVLALAMCFGLVACGDDGQTPVGGSGDVQPNGPAAVADGDAGTSVDNPIVPAGIEDGETYTWSSALASISTNWNPLDYEDSGSSDIFSPLTDALYSFFFNDSVHPYEGGEIEPFSRYVISPSMAADMPTDITEQVKAEHPDWIPASATSGYAWSIPLREDLYFDTGYHITADTYVQSMKYMLDPKLQNYRATDVYANSNGIVGAEEYCKSGTYALSEFVSSNFGDDEYVNPADFTLTPEGTYQVDGKDVVLDLTSGGNWGSNSLNDYYDAYVDSLPALVAAVDPLKAAANEKGWVYLTPELLTDVQNAIAALQGYDSVEAYAADRGDYAYQEFEEMAFLGMTYPEVAFEDTVGFYAADEYTLVQVFKAGTTGFYLYYGGIQDWLVEPDVYEASLAQDEAGNWYSNYMTSADTSPSYGPYSMTEYQTEKLVHYSRNDSWFGWTDEIHVYQDPVDGLYYRMNQYTDLDYQVVAENSTRKQMFLAGELMSYGLDAEDYDAYGHSEYLKAAPGASIFFITLTGNMEGLQAREAVADFDQSKNDLETITVLNFRKALAISFDKQAFCDEIMPSQTPGYGIFGSQIIYDPDTCGFYRDTEAAKQALCDFYSVDVSEYDSLDDAEASLTGYDPETASELYTAAYNDAIAAGYITDADGDGICDQTITLTYACSNNTDRTAKTCQFFNEHIGDSTDGTPFEGKIKFVESAPLGDTEWANALKNGTADFALCGWTGSSMDPFGLLTAYTWDSYSYAAKWYDTTKDMLTLNIDGEDVTMSVYDWAEAVNGNIVTIDGQEYVYGVNEADQDTRVQILAGVEGKLLQCYSYLPFLNDGSKSLLSQQVFYVVDEYIPVLGFGGSTYARFNYSDSEWKTYVDEQIAAHGQLQY